MRLSSAILPGVPGDALPILTLLQTAFSSEACAALIYAVPSSGGNSLAVMPKPRHRCHILQDVARAAPTVEDPLHPSAESAGEDPHNQVLAASSLFLCSRAFLHGSVHPHRDLRVERPATDAKKRAQAAGSTVAAATMMPIHRR